MRIALLHDDVLARAGATPDEIGVLEAVDAVDTALKGLGHSTARVPIGEHHDVWMANLEMAAAGLVFNLCEGVAGRSDHEFRIAAMVEMLGLPITGSSSETLALGRRKDRVNAILADAGMPIPEWTLARRGFAPPEWSTFPAIVKPAAEDASVGISQRSIVRDAAALDQALAENARHAPLLVQEFLPGHELNVGIVGNVVLPVAQIDFRALPGGAWPLVSYRAKWQTGSDEDLGTLPRCPAELPDELLARASELALTAWRLIEGRGYGRVDLRCDAHDNLFVLEVNPNPDLAPSAGLARMALVRGWNYTEMIERIVLEARARAETKVAG
jgi:D-alanine-D-alanine ligase